MSPQLFTSLYGISRWLFAFFALFLFFVAFSWLRAERKKHRDRFRSLPGAGTVGEMVVLLGSSQLPENTWFPVPREGVLGSLRTCDLVVPCPGVRSRHLDFTWQDGTGLLLRPRPGCGVLVDGVPVEGASDALSMPLTHGSTLQVGSALLRLQVFAALDNTPRAADPAGFPAQAYQPPAPPGPLPMPPDAVVPGPYFPGDPAQPPMPYPPPAPPAPPDAAALAGQPSSVQPDENASPAPAPEASGPARPSAPRRRRSDRWKEDWSE